MIGQLVRIHGGLLDGIEGVVEGIDRGRVLIRLSPGVLVLVPASRVSLDRHGPDSRIDTGDRPAA